MSARERNWIVPVAIKDRYWTARFYAGGYPTARQAEASVRVLVSELPIVLGAAGEHEFVIGRAEETP